MPSDEPDRLAALREEYTREGLAEEDLPPSPITLLSTWMDEAIDAGIYDPSAMVLSTVTATGQPSSRTVLLKGLAERGLVFFTNYDSHKGEQLAGQPECALLFPWYAVQRQVRVEGAATKLPEDESDAYFAGRPRGSQLGAWASPQSRVVESREVLDERYAEIEEEFEGRDVPRPPHWGGYLVEPVRVEFWQGRGRRMHDRIRYQRVPTRPSQPWMWQRLAP